MLTLRAQAYFQRLRPFPRCLLRRDAIKFKDYPKKSPVSPYPRHMPACAAL